MLMVKRVRWGLWAIWDTELNHEVKGAPMATATRYPDSTEAVHYRPIYFKRKREALASLTKLLTE